MGNLFVKALEKYAPKSVTTVSLSGKTGIERSILTKIRGGKLNPSSMEKVEKLCTALMLTPGQARELKESYLIDLVGSECWQRRQLIKDMLENFESLFTETPFNFPEPLISKEYFPRGTTVIKGKDNLCRLLLSLIIADGDYISACFPPELEALLNICKTAIKQCPSMHFKHFMALEQNNVKNEYNINCFKSTIPLCFGNADYQPYYFYSTPSDFIGVTPWFFITQSFAVAISFDLHYAIISDEANFREMYLHMQKKLEEISLPFYNRVDDYMTKVDYSEKSVGANVLEEERIRVLQYDPCINMLARPEESEFLLRKDMPNREEIVKMLSTSEEIIKAHNRLNGLKYDMFFTEEGLNSFAETGLPSMERDSDPFPPEYRKTLLDRFLQKSADDSYRPFIINTHDFKCPKNVQIVCYSERSASIMFYNSSSVLRHADLKEISLTGALWDFLCSLPANGNTLNKAESEDKIKLKLNQI